MSKERLSRCGSDRRGGATPNHEVRRNQDGRPARLAGAASGARAVCRSAAGHHQSDPRLHVGARHRGSASAAFPADRGSEHPSQGNRYLSSVFVQAAWVVLVKIGPKHWDRYGLKSWIEAARKRLHHNVLAVALANKLARIAWAVLHKGRAFECVKTNETAYRPA